jgi:hypothetical protein
MYGSHIPSLGKELLEEIFGAAAPSWNAACIEALFFFLPLFLQKFLVSSDKR